MVTLSSATVLPHEADNRRDTSHEGGFKQTDLTPLPKDWDLVRLGDVCEFQNGVNADAKAYGKGIPFANVLEAINNTFLDASRIPGRVEVPKATINAFRVLRGDILFNRTSETLEEVGLTAVYLDDTLVVFGGFVVRGRPKPGTFDPTYLGYALRARLVRTQIASKGQGAVRANISQAELRNVRVPRPPDNEQQAIARALSDADALVESLEQLLEKKRLIKQGVMHDLLSGRRRLPGFSGEWGERPFGDVFAFLPTATNSRADLGADGDAYYVHYGDIHTRFDLHLDFALAKLPKIKREKCPTAALLRNGDWIVVDASEDVEGACKAVEVRGLSDDDLAVSGLHTFLLREKTPAFVPGFKGHLGSAAFLRKQYLRVMTGMKVYGVSKTAMRDLLIPVPPTKEQAALVEVFDDMNTDIAALEAKLEKARQIKQGMMQELLTARVRLV